MVLVAALALGFLALAGWAISIRTCDVGVVDRLWGIAQVVVVAACLVVGETRTARAWLCAALVTVWGLRLSGYLWWRERGSGEDWRHNEKRRTQPGFWWRSLSETFLVQLVGGGLLIGAPMLAVVSGNEPSLVTLDFVGVAVWALGLTIETTADFQLARFRAQPSNRGLLFREGLWRFSRHPNYLGEITLWLGIALVGLASGEWWALISPAMVLVVMTRISGTRVMDEHLSRTRGSTYDAYVRTTSGLIPGRQRRATQASDADAPSTVAERAAPRFR